MRVFLDANILVSVLNKEYPIFSYSARILSLASHSKFEIVTSPLCLAIAFYFAEKKHRTVKAKEKIKLLCDYIEITSASKAAVSKSLNNAAVLDFEDGLEYYAALESNCKCIVTEDVSDFYFSEIEVLTSEIFCKRYLA